MFSEYASRFLSQSQSRLSNFAGQADNDNAPSRYAPDRSYRQARNLGRSYFSKTYGVNPYQQTSNSRYGHNFRPGLAGAQDAPLFASARDEFREEDEEEERDREAADLYALQRSRRVAAASKLVDSVGSENDASDASLYRSYDDTPSQDHIRGFRRGIRSSWNGGPQSGSIGAIRGGKATAGGSSRAGLLRYTDRDSDDVNKSRAGLEDVGLESQIEDDEPPASLIGDSLGDDDNPPAFQQFKARSDRNHLLRRESTIESEDELRRTTSVDDDGNATTPMPSVEGEFFRYDSFFAWAYLILLASLVSTYVLVWLHTSAPDGKKPIGDTIYATLHGSFYMLAVDTLVAVATALLWLAALRSFVRPVVSVILVAVPVIMVSFSLYPFISSFQGATHGSSFQDKALRWAATVPFVAAVVWVYCVVKGRHSIRQAVDILEFSSRILAANSALVLVGLASLFVVVAWTWVWLGMFSRVFLGGYMSKRLARYVISLSSWWLGVWFVFMYMWTISIVTEVHRATTAATVSQWYFHRNATPAPTSQEIVSAALSHSLTTIFGSICESTLLARLVRIPLLVLPSRISYIVQRVANAFVPTPVVALMNPLTITYCAIHSQHLAAAARGLSQMEFISPQTPTATLTPRVFTSGEDTAGGLLPYRLSKLILYASRFILATAMGFAGWVITAKKLEIALPDGMGIRGSAYAYVVGLVASFIGYSVMGSMESILSGIVDAVVICYGSERRMASGGGTYCMEAAYLFGEKRRHATEDYV
ncbi:related to choline transporter-like protein [Cephalotrichum gorgonifer]|uniref:Protein PNS1 n=1 Tax=Cephalotrichum gorgonifer TaxID=2041049 RepID=A0AAE8SWN9_9PEZI|nr:related to choline transporter-like protein [Cephalotrichum gorgonifer]